MQQAIQLVSENLVFVLDMSRLDKPQDVCADDLGSWVCNSKRYNSCEIEDGHVMEIYLEQYYKQATSGDFRRIVAEIYGNLLLLLCITFTLDYLYFCLYVDPSGNQLNLAFIQYSFTGHPHCVISKPHGNSKINHYYLSFLQHQALLGSYKKKSPKELIHSVTKEKGGIQKLKAAGEFHVTRSKF